MKSQTPPPPHMGHPFSPPPHQMQQQYHHQQQQQQYHQIQQHHQQQQQTLHQASPQHLQENMMMSPEVFDLQPSYDVEFVYPPGMDPEAVRRRMTPQMSMDDGEDGPTTAQIIAAQSQDYVDERLAEYQATIQHLQGFLFFCNSVYFIFISSFCSSRIALHLRVCYFGYSFFVPAISAKSFQKLWH